jgi:hypothetical protein
MRSAVPGCNEEHSFARLVTRRAPPSKLRVAGSSPAAPTKSPVESAGASNSLRTCAPSDTQRGDVSVHLIEELSQHFGVEPRKLHKEEKEAFVEGREERV